MKDGLTYFIDGNGIQRHVVHTETDCSWVFADQTQDIVDGQAGAKGKVSSDKVLVPLHVLFQKDPGALLSQIETGKVNSFCIHQLVVEGLNKGLELHLAGLNLELFRLDIIQVIEPIR